MTHWQNSWRVKIAETAPLNSLNDSENVPSLHLAVVKVEYVYLIRPNILIPVLQCMHSLIKRLYVFRNLICLISPSGAAMLESRSFTAE